MSLMNTILKRRSVRKYTDQDIDEDTLKQIVQAGLLAPTSRNLKPCEFYVVKDKEILKQLSGAKQMGGKMIAECNAAIVVFADEDKADTWVEDCSIALSFMMLMAEELNIGNCFVQYQFRKDGSGNDAEENVRSILKVSKPMRMTGILALGIQEGSLKGHELSEADWTKVHQI